MFTAVMRVLDNRVVKFMDGFATKDEALAHIERANAPPPPPEQVEGEDPVAVPEHVIPYPDAFVTDYEPPLATWWVEGTTITVVPLPIEVPDRVSSRQFKLQLLEPILPAYPDGIEALVTAFIAASPRPVQIAYENSGTFVRTEPMMAAGFAALGFTPEQIDAFFIAANAK